LARLSIPGTIKKSPGPHHVVREVPLCDHHINKIQSQLVRIAGMVYDLWSF